MMFKKLVLVLFACTIAQAKEYPQFVPIENLFSDKDLALSIREQEDIKTLLFAIQKSSINEQLEAAREAKQSLQQEVEKRRIHFESADEKDKPFIGYKAGILISQAHWLDQFIQMANHCLPLHKRATQLCKTYFKKLKVKTSQFFNAKPTTSSLTTQLLSYARLEREKIFTTYESTVALAVAHEHKELPLLMAFWSLPKKQWLLLTESKKFLVQPQVQMDAILGLGDEAEITAEAAALAEADANAARIAAKAGDEEGGEGVSTFGGDASELYGFVEAEVKTSLKAKALANANEVKKNVLEKYKVMDDKWNASAEELEKSMAGKGVSRLGQGIRGYFKFFSRTAPQALTKSLFFSPMKTLLSFLPKALSMDSVAADIVGGALPEDIATTNIAAERAEGVVNQFAKQAKSMERGPWAKRFGLNKVTQDDLDSLSDHAAANDLQGSIKIQLNQARADAARVLANKPPSSILGKMMFRMGNKLRSAEGAAQRGLRGIDSSTGQNLDDALTALHRAHGLEPGDLDPLTKDGQDLQDLTDQVQRLRKQLTTPLVRSSRYIRAMGRMDEALAKNYPIVHGLVHMALFMDFMMAGELAVHWENVTQAKEYLAITQRRNAIGAKLESQVSKISLSKAAAERQIGANTLTLITAMTSIQSKMGSGYVQQNNYIVQSVAGHTPQHMYISQPMQYDQYFYFSPMLTPNQETPLFPKQDGPNTPWKLAPKRPPVFNKTTGGWIVSQNNSNAPTAPGTGAWFAGGTNREQSHPHPIIYSKKLSIPKNFPTNAVAHTWYNPFRFGNWIFNPEANSFFQYQVFPMTSSSAPQGDASLALQNSIFTEYIPPVILNEKDIQTYVVQVEMKIYSAQPPFFAGFFFNGGRWVSGSSDLRTQQRLFGFYGNQHNEIALYGTETAYTSDENQLLEATSITALEQVFASQQTKASWKSLKGTLIPNPLFPNKKDRPISLEIGKTYILTAVTQSTNIMLSLQEQTDQGLKTLFGPYTIINRNPFVFLYHNIGFISAGCSAGFKIRQPYQLIYNQEALDKFKKELGLPQTTAARTT